MIDCKPILNSNNFNLNNPSSTMQSSANSNLRPSSIGKYNGKLPSCVGCNKPIADRFLLQTMETYWHEDCLKCEACDCRLGEVGSSLYTKSDMLLCRTDYLRLFGSKGCCAICKKIIYSYELVIKSKQNNKITNYHVECFACHICNHRFCVGENYYVQDDKILCEYDYLERINGSQNSPVLNNNSGMSPASDCANTLINNNNLRTNTSNHISSA